MRTHSDIVKDAAKPAQLAQECGVSVHTIRSWIGRGSIPSTHWRLFADNGWATLDELADGASVEAPASAAAS